MREIAERLVQQGDGENNIAAYVLGCTLEKCISGGSFSLQTSGSYDGDTVYSSSSRPASLRDRDPGALLPNTSSVKIPLNLAPAENPPKRWTHFGRKSANDIASQPDRSGHSREANYTTRAPVSSGYRPAQPRKMNYGNVIQVRAQMRSVCRRSARERGSIYWI